MKLRNTLERYLKKSGLTASALAEKAGVPKATLLGWLAGKAPRDFNQLRSVARFIGTSIDALVFDDEPSGPFSTKLLPGLLPDDDGWHKGFLEVRFRHVNSNGKKS